MSATKGQIAAWARRMATIHRKASDLFGEVEAAYGDEHKLTNAAGDVMCSAAEACNWFSPNVP